MAKGKRGYHHRTHNPFERNVYEVDEDAQVVPGQDEHLTKLIAIFPKTLVNKVVSPDIPFDWSMNPYQGCEHGCSYCYARTTHNYWGYSAGLDFESIILYKPQAAELLLTHFAKKSWTGAPIMLSGNTDCYQPVERKLKITRQLLEICLKHRNPVSIITKNSLIVRDLDILTEMAANQLVHVAISITTLQEELRRALEPRTSSAAQKLDTIRKLTDAGIPVTTMMAPIIPSLNDHEILTMAKMTSEAGASRIGYTILRLNGELEDLFMAWLDEHFSLRKNKVINQLKSIHEGKTGSSVFGARMKGGGNWSAMIAKQMDIARRKYFSHTLNHELDRSKFIRPSTQFRLFDVH